MLGELLSGKQLLANLPRAGGWRLSDLYSPFQPKQFYDSVRWNLFPNTRWGMTLSTTAMICRSENTEVPAKQIFCVNVCVLIHLWTYSSLKYVVRDHFWANEFLLEMCIVKLASK